MSGRCVACNTILYDRPPRRVIEGVTVEEDLCRDCLPIANNPDDVDWRWKQLEELCRNSEGISEAYAEYRRNAKHSWD